MFIIGGFNVWNITHFIVINMGESQSNDSIISNDIDFIDTLKGKYNFEMIWFWLGSCILVLFINFILIYVTVVALEGFSAFRMNDLSVDFESQSLPSHFKKQNVYRGTGNGIVSKILKSWEISFHCCITKNVLCIIKSLLTWQRLKFIMSWGHVTFWGTILQLYLVAKFNYNCLIIESWTETSLFSTET